MRIYYIYERSYYVCMYYIFYKYHAIDKDQVIRNTWTRDETVGLRAGRRQSWTIIKQ